LTDNHLAGRLYSIFALCSDLDISNPDTTPDVTYTVRNPKRVVCQTVDIKQGQPLFDLMETHHLGYLTIHPALNRVCDFRRFWLPSLTGLDGALILEKD
jgi:hypothetical protein